MSRTLSLRNRQRVRPVNTALLRRVVRHVLAEQLRATGFELAIHLVAAPEMARLNKSFLNHEGSTDVITFDHSEGTDFESRVAAARNAGLEAKSPKPETRLAGEIFVCLDDAVMQARQFRTTWQSELTRYVIHGLLHLCGYDDLNPAARRAMKRLENRLLREASRTFALGRLQMRNPRPRTQSFAAKRHASSWKKKQQA